MRYATLSSTTKHKTTSIRYYNGVGKKKLKIHRKVPRLEEQVEEQVTNDSQHMFLGAKNITL
jgi:hypothetical protein